MSPLPLLLSFLLRKCHSFSFFAAHFCVTLQLNPKILHYRTVIPTLALDSGEGSKSQSSGSTPTGSIVGGVVGGAAGVALIVAGLVLYKRRNRRKIPAATFDDDEFYGDPYQQNNTMHHRTGGGEWSGQEFIGGFPGTGELPSQGSRTLDNDEDDEEAYYRSQRNRRSWWSSVSSLFSKR